MAREVIVNGTFTGSVSGWTKQPGRNMFVHSSNMAYAEGFSDDAEDRFWMYQEFEITGEVLSALFDAWVQYDVTNVEPLGAGTPYVEFYVILYQPDATEITLYHEKITSKALANKWALQNEDILTYLDQTGIYRLNLICDVYQGSGAAPSKGWFDSISLEIEDIQPLEFLEDWEMTEHFLIQKEAPMETVEDFAYTEHFTIQKIKGLATAEERMVVAYSDKKVYDFREGNLVGAVITGEIDMGTPGEEKSPDELILFSDAESSHAITVYISIDGKTTWTLVGTVAIQKGSPQFLHMVHTSEAFHLKFVGAALSMVGYAVYAIPRGRDIKDA